jgi:hypothetical protein
MESLAETVVVEQVFCEHCQIVEIGEDEKYCVACVDQMLQELFERQ